MLSEVVSISSFESELILRHLHSIYQFVDKPASDDQTKDSIKWIIDFFKAFLLTLSSCDHTASMFQLNQSELSALQSSMTQMSKVHWYPNYASAILILESSLQGEADIALVGCDQWKFSPRLLPGGESEHVAESKHYLESSCGSLPIEEMADLFERIDWKLQKKVAKETKSAANGKGHQMTPAFLRSVVIDVVAKLDDDSESKARGATTDISMHTGSRRRCTMWPLFLAVLDRCIKRNNNAPLLPSKILMHFDLYAFDTAMVCFRGTDTPFIEQLDTQFHILSSASERALQLSALASRHGPRGSDLSVIKEMICAGRNELDRHCREFSERVNHRYTIGSFECRPSSPQLLDPTIVEVADNVYSEDRVQRNLLSNIGLIDGFNLSSPLRGVTFRSLFIYLDKSYSLKDTMKYSIRTALLLKTIEAVFYHKAALLDVKATMGQMTTDELECMEKITVQYSSVLDALIVDRDWQESWFVDLRSVEMVVHWIACCLVHKSLCMTYPLLNEYSIPLSYRDLKHLVLTDGESIDAAKLVAIYLKKYNQNPSNEIFNPEVQSKTIDFASRFASSNRAMVRRYDEQVDHIEAEKKTYMSLINRRKDELYRLRIKLSVHLAERKHQSNIQGSQFNTSQFHIAYKIKSELEGKINVANKAPAFIKSSLPETRTEALAVLFFLHMPSDIDLWSKMVVASKSMLLQRGTKTRFDDDYVQFLASIKNPTVTLSWASYFKSIRASTSLSDRSMIYYPLNLRVPDAFGPSLVDDIEKAQIWYPDVSSNFITKTISNPFLAIEHWTSRIYTETIDSKVDFCLWNPVHPTEPSSRGNDPYAAYDSLPPDLSKCQQIAVASLRSYPHAQMRKLAIMLRDTSIPIDNKVTATAIRMALFNIGELDLSDVDKPKQLLRRDMELGVSESIYSSLQKWRDIIANNKVHIDKMEILLSDICFLMSQESTAFQDLSMEFCQVVEQWLKANFDELKKGSLTAHQIENIEIDNVRLLSYALLSLPLHKSGLKNAAVSLKALSLLTMFHNGFSSIVFVKDIAQMRMKILSRICGCSRSLFENVSASMDKLRFEE